MRERMVPLQPANIDILKALGGACAASRVHHHILPVPVNIHIFNSTGITTGATEDDKEASWESWALASLPC